jgi:hypothetical protein
VGPEGLHELAQARSQRTACTAQQRCLAHNSLARLLLLLWWCPQELLRNPAATNVDILGALQEWVAVAGDGDDKKRLLVDGAMRTALAQRLRQVGARVVCVCVCVSRRARADAASYMVAHQQLLGSTSRLGVCPQQLKRVVDERVRCCLRCTCTSRV